jgi:hypothetical protein
MEQTKRMVGPIENGLIPLIWVPRGWDHGWGWCGAFLKEREWKFHSLSLSSHKGRDASFIYQRAKCTNFYWMDESLSKFTVSFFTYHAFFFHLKACFMRLDFSRCSTSSIFIFFLFLQKWIQVISLIVIFSMQEGNYD